MEIYGFKGIITFKYVKKYNLFFMLGGDFNRAEEMNLFLFKSMNSV